MRGEGHGGLQSQQGDVCTPVGRQEVVVIGVWDDLSHLHQPVWVIEPQLPDLHPEGRSLRAFPEGEGPGATQRHRAGAGPGSSCSRNRVGCWQSRGFLCSPVPGPQPTPTPPCAPIPVPLPSYGGSGRSDPPSSAVGRGEHPLGVDEGAPTHVLPLLMLLAVPLEAGLPWPPAGGGGASCTPHCAMLLPPQVGIWEAEEVPRQGPLPGCTHSVPPRGRLTSPLCTVRGCLSSQGRGQGVRTHPGTQARSPRGPGGSGRAATASAGRAGPGEASRARTWGEGGQVGRVGGLLTAAHLSLPSSPSEPLRAPLPPRWESREL